MLDHKETRSRQVSGKMAHGEGGTGEMENTPSCEATMYGEKSRGIKFDDPAPDCTKAGKMEEEHTSGTR